MSERKICPQCNNEIPADAPTGGLCPRCLMQQGLQGPGAPTRTNLGSGPGRKAPAPEEIAAAFPQLEIIELIGQGGMGAVYKARQTKLDRIVALKIVTAEVTHSEVFAERFTREARTLARVSHPNIVTVHDFGEVEGLYYFVMEYVDGANLRDVLNAGKLSAKDTLAIVPQICEALQYAHEEGVVHRDIKPENILIDRRGTVKIADFGLAKMLLRERVDFTLTVPGQVMGTPAYMAPEQIETPSDVDHRADIYSLGVVFYEMLTGELPLGRFSAPSQRVQLDVRIDDVVLRSLEKERERRYQQADEFKTDVEVVSSGGTATPPPERAPRRAATPPPAPVPEKIDAPPPPAPPPQQAVAAAVPPAPPRPPEPPAAGKAATPPGPTGPTRKIEIRRPSGITWVVVYLVVMLLMGAGAWSVNRLGSFSPGINIALDRHYLGLPSIGSLLGMGRGAWVGAPRISWIMTAWYVLTMVGLVRLKTWGRVSAIVLTVLGLFAYVPVGTVLSILALIYLLRKDVVRVFELGEGPAELDVEEADRIERMMGRARA
ncbi:MAG: serine/threonine protein kinase [bacterium]|nr:serine/threonine protein kinase [bacterium]